MSGVKKRGMRAEWGGYGKSQGIRPGREEKAPILLITGQSDQNDRILNEESGRKNRTWLYWRLLASARGEERAPLQKR